MPEPTRPEPTRPESVKPPPITPVTQPIEVVEQKEAPHLRPRLTNDTGASVTDGYTRDATVFVHDAEFAEHGWEFRIGQGPWLRGSGQHISDKAFPSEGEASVAVRALDPRGRPWGEPGTLTFDIDRTPPQPVLLTPSGEGGEDLHEILLHEPGASVLWAPGHEPFRLLEGLVLPVPAGTTVRVLQRDRAGNDSPVIDFDAPAREELEPDEAKSESSKPASEQLRPPVTLRLKNDTGRNDEQRSDGITSDATVLIDGIDPAVHYALGFKIGDGPWQSLIGNELHDRTFGEGPQTVTVEALDPLGVRVGTQQTLNFTVDRVRPPLPTIVVEPKLGHVDGKGNPFQPEWALKVSEYILTRDGKVRIDGVPEGGSWTYTVISGEYSSGRIQAIDQPGFGTHLPASALKAGPNMLFVDVFDQAGNGALNNVIPIQGIYLDTRPLTMPPSTDGAVL